MFTIEKDSAAVRLHIHRGSKEKNQAVFEQLEARRTDIEKKLKEPSEWKWDAPRQNQYRQISYVFKHCGQDAEGEDRKQLLDNMVDKMCELVNALKEHIDKLPR